LTRFTEADLERVITERLSPLYVSIHATDPEVRTHMLRNRRGAMSLRWLEAILEADIEVHGQIVCCPDVNNGRVLEQTLAGVLDRYEKLRSQRLRAESEPSSLLGTGVDPERCEILGVTGAGESALVVLGLVRDGLTVGSLDSE
jgi:hypothetical protein